MVRNADHSQPWLGVLSDPKGLNDGLAVYFTEQIAEAHSRTIGEKPHISLEMLGTLPEYRGQGAGGQHVQLGRELAEKYKMLCIVDASPSSAHLCTKLGSREEDIMTIDLSHWGRRRNIYFQSYGLQAAKFGDLI
ncbi:hypothetical protein NA56DRAFT_663810 [Hyaloscypha hepaticicola]|uniref:N-acetyltransferase domain-containing protein n=1 Tax=Hyaloscypha hepaticicola TaxID=2082293 RepID=A0A2J6PNP1_9HELO|nr:hypothetical protein NA56DRAFT_663810 [Hyaloscypha hepaticicola]